MTVNYNPTGFPNNITDTATDCVDVKPPQGGEGCTPGFWKQDQHFDSWVGFAPTDSFEAVFGVDVTLRVGGQGTVDDPTLLDALNATGGGVNALARHAVAALLNASNPDVDSDFTVARGDRAGPRGGCVRRLRNGPSAPRSSERARLPVELTPSIR